MRRLLILSVLAGLSSAPALGAPDTAIVARRSPEQVISNLTAYCIRTGWQVESINGGILTCTKSPGFVGQLLFGSRYGTPPVTRAHFIAVSNGEGGSLLQVSQSIESVSAFGRPDATPLPVRDMEALVKAATGAAKSSDPASPSDANNLNPGSAPPPSAPDTHN